MNIGGNVTGMNQVSIVNDSSEYTFSVNLVEKYNGQKVMVVELTNIAAN
jgi:hypothetical protein